MEIFQKRPAKDIKIFLDKKKQKVEICSETICESLRKGKKSLADF